MDTWD